MGGDDPGKSCVFPFKHLGVIYTECTSAAAGNSDEDPKPWCSTLTDVGGTHVAGKWGYCAPECLTGKILCEIIVPRLR